MIGFITTGKFTIEKKVDFVLSILVGKLTYFGTVSIEGHYMNSSIIYYTVSM